MEQCSKKQFVNGVMIDDNGQINHVNIEVDHGKIVRFSDIINYDNDSQIIDLNNNLIIPTFNNQHLHLGETIYRPLPRKMGLLAYISYTEQRNKEFGDQGGLLRRKSVHETLLECIKNGTTEINTIRNDDMIGNFPIKARCGYPIMQSYKLKAFIENGIEGFDHFYEQCLKNKLEPGVFFHSFYMNDERTIELTRQIIGKYGCFFAAHIAEDLESEVIVSQKWNGCNSMQLLRKFDLLSTKTTLVHCGYIKEKELEWIRDSGSSVAICPLSSDTLLTKTADPVTMEDMGIKWSIATDGLASGLTANQIDQANHLKTLFPELTYNQLLKAITVDHNLSINQDATFLTYNTDSVDEIFKKNLPIQSIYVKGEYYEQN